MYERLSRNRHEKDPVVGNHQKDLDSNFFVKFSLNDLLKRVYLDLTQDEVIDVVVDFVFLDNLFPNKVTVLGSNCDNNKHETVPNVKINVLLPILN